ncbi:MAG: hypothetical protein JO249_24190 [Acidobacteria bacterium]|nr:hypothetical protein [Acidobacteriota bacterium]
MSSIPPRPSAEPEVTEEERAIIREWMTTYEQDKLNTVDGARSDHGNAP